MMDNESLISIVIITCNRKDELKRVIDSCLKNVGMNCEIIIVDNGSTDGTKEMLKTYKNITEYKFEIRSFFLGKNMGVAGGRNYGFSEAKSKVVYFIDDDAYFSSDSVTLKIAYEYMIEHDEVYAMATEIFDVNRNDYLRDTFEKGCKKKSNCKVLSYIGASHFIRKDKFKGNDLYPKSFFYGSEERYASMIGYDQSGITVYYGSLKIIHEPSSKTRLSKIEIEKNIKINKYVIKKMILPKFFLPICFLLNYARMCHLFKFNINKINESLNLVKKRYKKSSYITYKLEMKTVFELIRLFGFLNII